MLEPVCALDPAVDLRLRGLQLRLGGGDVPGGDVQVRLPGAGLEGGQLGLRLGETGLGDLHGVTLAIELVLADGAGVAHALPQLQLVASVGQRRLGLDDLGLRGRKIFGAGHGL